MAPKWRRSKKAVSVLNEFIRKHMKTDEVVICKELNEKIWENGIKNPPGKVSVIALKTKINGVEKTLVNLKDNGIDKQLELYKSQMPKVAEAPKAEEKASVKEEKPQVKDAKVTEKKTEEKKEEVKESKAPAKKKEDKKEVKKDEW